MANSGQVVCFISSQGLCAKIGWLNPEFQFTATDFMSMAAKSRDLVDKTSGATLQMEGHVDMLSQSAKDQWELEAFGSSPYHLPSWSLARRPPSSCPNAKHCLEICLTLTEELGAEPPPSHSGLAPLMEDMLHDIRTRFTKAVVTGPGRAVLFCEGLTMDKARDAALLHTGAGTWVGKSAYLTTDPMTIQEGWWAIAQAVTDCWVRARGLGHPCVNPLAQKPFRFDCPRGSSIKDASADGGSNCQPEITIDVGETKDLHHLSSPHLPQIMGSRVIGVQYQWLPQYCLGLIGQTDPSIPDKGDSTERKELTWR